ncbi:MAG: hypothetical protein GC203_10450 [Phenylobacterium sp.]|uniref:DUF6270 domain-containing protein n=1 Tax=Phenylobacterium sp. TaxID=1871053 RepID=UPI0025CBAFAA|nr:DUF6270 domain-containing protein [Phenylobacterium sp.]MBI1198272.1 hypothetical protein [Phenylobacterium sp.]
MTRIAIVGSCITRDLWPIRGGGAEHLTYISRTSLPSLLAEPAAGFRPARQPPADMRKHEHNALVADLRKTALTRLIAARPTHIIFDFIDERFDLLATGDAVSTHSAELIRSGYLAQAPFKHARPIPRLSAAAERLWLEAAEEFAALVRATPLAGAKLILHSARWATEQRMADGTTRPIRNVELTAGRPVEIGPYNELLARQEAAFEALMPPMARVEAAGLRLADPGHAWGLSPFHYISEYYNEIRDQLAELGVSAPASAPSVPAA